MTYSQMVEDLWYLLLSLDNSWQYAPSRDEVVLINRYGQEVHAGSEESALQAALSLVRAQMEG